MSVYQLSDEQIAQYHQDGYLIISKLFSSEEITRLYQVAIDDTTISRHSYDLNDQSGKKTRLALWFTPGNDIYSLLTHSERIVQSVDKLLDSSSPVCHFHSKLMQKEPRVGRS